MRAGFWFRRSRDRARVAARGRAAEAVPPGAGPVGLPGEEAPVPCLLEPLALQMQPLLLLRLRQRLPGPLSDRLPGRRPEPRRRAPGRPAARGRGRPRSSGRWAAWSSDSASRCVRSGLGSGLLGLGRRGGLRPGPCAAACSRTPSWSLAATMAAAASIIRRLSSTVATSVIYSWSRPALRTVRPARASPRSRLERGGSGPAGTATACGREREPSRRERRTAWMRAVRAPAARRAFS